MDVTQSVTDLATRALEVALGCTATQHRVATNNLANIETPGYQAKRVTFEDRLERAVRAEQGGAKGALASMQPELSDTGDPAGPDGNNVSIEGEMLMMGEATERYQMLTRLLDRKLQMIGTAIGDGRS